MKFEVTGYCSLIASDVIEYGNNFLTFRSSILTLAPTLKMEAARSFEMLAKVCNPTRRHALDNNILQIFQH